MGKIITRVTTSALNLYLESEDPTLLIDRFGTHAVLRSVEVNLPKGSVERNEWINLIDKYEGKSTNIILTDTHYLVDKHGLYDWCFSSDFDISEDRIIEILHQTFDEFSANTTKETMISCCKAIAYLNERRGKNFIVFGTSDLINIVKKYSNNDAVVYVN